MASSTAAQTVSVGGHRLKLTNLDKVLYPATGTTKGEVLAYLAAVADALLPHTSNRPATRKRWPNGVEGPVFFQKNLDAGTPSWVRRRTIVHKDHTNDYPLVNDLATLTWLGQIAALEIHVPQWQFGRTGIQKNPDRLVLDLDPGEGAGLPECAEVARLARDVLRGMGLDPLPVTSGSKGIHLYAALDGRQTTDEVSAVAHELARHLEAEHPDLVVSDMKKALRAGKVLVDWSQNNGSKTTIAPYSLRGRAHPTVAAPRTWDELDDPDLAQLDKDQVVERVERMGDPLAALTAGHLASLEPTPERMATFARKGAAPSGGQGTGPDGEPHHRDEPTDSGPRRDRLETYRAKRDASKTPEPVPEEVAPTSQGNSFVIQEHHARRLHWDFRLEHDGVLVSWALPRGEPTDPKQNHLAVQTEDHPLAYGAFEGTIPAGEYGGGEVTIWDAGTYELEKWRDDEEVIVTLHGEQHGTRRLALIRTGGHGGGRGGGKGEENNWLIHLMAPRDAGLAAPHPSRSGAPAQKPPEPDEPASAALPRPMLATAGTVEALTAEGDPDDWAYEMKWDGFRVVAQVTAGAAGPVVRLVSRSGKDMTVTYPELADLASRVRAEELPVVVDGEIVALDARGRPSFRRLQQRANLTKAGDVAAARAKVGVELMLFDVLSVGGRSVVRRTYDERREILEGLVDGSGIVHVPPAFDGDLAGAVATSRRLGLEGVVAKRRTSTYTAGRRSRSWIKVKHSHSQEVVVVGWRPGHGDRSHLVGSLLLAVPDDEGLRYVGRVGSGFTEKDRRDLVTRLGRIERVTNPALDVPAADASDARWVTPHLVGEVDHADWTSTAEGDGRLRHAVWRGWRPDRSPEDVRREG
ncbi:ATP-dependent DNA ligase [Oerskovia turbata]|uniref:DNA ligase (ATP) n=1 Tax=Oerskovia turbata TaxID=1713 RepID=A0A4Q1L3V1_9CELL|nr:ATP-dependent DNA ligase [Oerskovia turbata]RXR26186.1 ATP-dependent DNA ligase [Oerskovia turbata]RXR36688.1 ATP-dependent DNA ligase [Oerskovia turbata]TGJ97377.1 ATP-dependent DNA ligase [Actinotalea fermentans ATCC 43279 = JCM 9966 = DSM 3133]